MRNFFFLLVMFSTSVIIPLSDPVGFQKFNSIVEQDIILNKVGKEFVDVKPMIENIPYTNDSRNIWDVEPRTRYKKSILEGNGNCSNFSFGAAFELGRKGVWFEIVHFLPRNELSSGRGHSLIRTRFKAESDSIHVGLVDFLYGGIVSHDGDPVDLPALIIGDVTNYKILSLAPSKGDVPFREAVDFSKSEYVVGRIKGVEVESYFRFIESVYIPLGSLKVEKLVYEGTALLLGIYPTVFVSPDQMLFKDNSGKIMLYRGGVWVLRVTAALWLIFLLVYSFKFIFRDRA